MISTLTRVTFPAGMPSNPPHHRSGAALYYILSGSGANTAGGKIEARGPASLIYEPSGLVHQWGNPGSEPVTFLVFRRCGSRASGCTSDGSIASGYLAKLEFVRTVVNAGKIGDRLMVADTLMRRGL